MDYSDLELQGQIVLASFVVLIGAAFLLRAVILLASRIAGIGRWHPDSWRSIYDAPSNRSIGDRPFTCPFMGGVPMPYSTNSKELAVR